MFLLYHAYVYLEFLILACTIYILAPVVLNENNVFAYLESLGYDSSKLVKRNDN